MKVRQRQTDLMKIKLKLIVLHSDLQNAVRGMFVFTHIIRERMRRLRVWYAAKAFLRSRFCSGLLAFQSDVQQAISPGSQVHSQKALVHVVTDRVVERRDVIANHEHDHTDVLVRHERNLRMKARQIAAVKSNQVAAI